MKILILGLNLFVVLPMITLSLVSCGGDRSSDNAHATASAESKFNKLGTDLKSALSAEELRWLLEVKEEIQTKALDHKSYGNVTYRWPSERTKMIKVGTSEMEKKVKNMVRINMPTTLKLYGMPDPVSAFNHQYKEITPEQMEKARKAIEDVKARRDKEAGVTPSETEKNATKSVMSGISGAASKLEYEAVNGLGDAAKWEKSGKKLIILDGDKILSIGCDISGDNNTCRDAAIKLAKKIYGKL